MEVAMKRNKLLIFLLSAIIIFGDAECQNSPRNGGSYQPIRPPRTNPSSRPAPPAAPNKNHAVNPNQIGGGAPKAGSNNRHSSGNVGPKPSAALPNQNVATKSNKESRQSGYPGQSHQNSNLPQGKGYNPPVGQPYHPGSKQPYNPSVSQSDHKPGGQPYNPPVHQPYQRLIDQPYNPPVSQPYQQSGSSLGNLAKEAAISTGVSAVVNAGVDHALRALSSGNNKQTDSQGNPLPPPPAPAVDTGSTAKPPEQLSPAPVTAMNEELIKLSEELFKADTNNAFKHITMKLQGQKTDDSVTDSATEPLLTVDPKALKIPTIAALRSLYDKYELDFEKVEKMTPEKRDGETNLINAFFATEVMAKAMKFIADKGLIPNDEVKFKDALKRIWFSQYARENNVISSSGFESVFLAEKIYADITGPHNWIYFNEQESVGRANYLGYIRKAKLGDNAAIVKLRATLNGIVQPVTTIFVGTSPELEMALYTVCFFVRPDGACPVSVGTTPLTIHTSKTTYFGKEILFSAYPEI